MDNSIKIEEVDIKGNKGDPEYQINGGYLCGLFCTVGANCGFWCTGVGTDCGFGCN